MRKDPTHLASLQDIVAEGIHKHTCFHELHKGFEEAIAWLNRQSDL